MKWPSRFLSSLVLTTVVTCAAFAQIPKDPVHMNSTDLDAWAQQQGAENRKQNKKESIKSFRQAIIRRLQLDRYTTDAAILRCVENSTSYEKQISSQAAGTKRFDNALRFIDDVLATLGDDRAWLKAKLVQQRGSLFLEGADFAGASKQFAASLKMIDPVCLKAEHDRVGLLVRLGQSLLSSGKAKDAERFFLIALSYPFYSILDHPEEMQQMRDLYVQAGRGLIDTRRNNRAALKEIVFVPAAMNELGPYLQTAIHEAEH